MGSHKPVDILTAAHREKFITGKEFKHLSAQLSNSNINTISEIDEDAHNMIEAFAVLHHIMQQILEEIEL